MNNDKNHIPEKIFIIDRIRYIEILDNDKIFFDNRKELFNIQN